MRPSPTPSGNDRRAFECRLRFSGRLVNAAIVAAEEPALQTSTRTTKAAPGSPNPAPAPELPAPPAPTPAVDPAEFWKTELARELNSDRKRIEDVLGKLQTATAEVNKDQSERLQQWQRAAIELALTIATRLLHERVLSGDFPMESKVRDMIQKLEDEAPVAIRLNPADLQLMESRLGGEPLVPGRDDPRLIPDSTLARGDCRVEGKDAMLLSDVGRELQEIRDELLRSLAHARP